MIILLLALVLATIALATPWRRMRVPARAWAVIGALNTLLAFGVPTTPATSHWRPWANALTAGTYWASLGLTVVGLVLWWNSDVTERALSRWLGPLVISALPFLIWSGVGLLYTF